MHDSVNSPTHYNKHGVECITAIKASMTDDEFKGYLKGNVLKYLWRYKYKNGLEDLLKAQWYLNKLIGENNVKQVRKRTNRIQQGIRANSKLRKAHKRRI